MKAEKGIWQITTGKGDRIYINCDDKFLVMHPESLCGINGLGIHGYENLKDLAVAILRFEKEKQKSESIENDI
jgi:hypothetical protein